MTEDNKKTGSQPAEKSRLITNLGNQTAYLKYLLGHENTLCPVKKGFRLL